MVHYNNGGAFVSWFDKVVFFVCMKIVVGLSLIDELVDEVFNI